MSSPSFRDDFSDVGHAIFCGVWLSSCAKRPVFPLLSWSVGFYVYGQTVFCLHRAFC